jgi:hypothetical protein
MSYENIPGWSRDILPFYDEMAKRIPHGGVFIEVGVFLGRSLAYMGQRRPDLELWAIDPWLDDTSTGYLGMGEYAELGAKHGGLFFAFLDLMRANAPDVLERVHIVRGTVDTIALDVAADMLFIDGAHDEESVKKDLHGFGYLVKKGGIVSGHDYQPDYQGVIDVVDSFFGKGNTKLGLGPEGEWSSCWWTEV